MKQIEITDEMYEFLTNLAKNMSEQNNRATQNVGFMVWEGKGQKMNDKPGVFLTEKACDEHIMLNNYHYNKKAVSYGISFWRNYEMVKLMNCVFKIAGIDTPRGYDVYFSKPQADVN